MNAEAEFVFEDENEELVKTVYHSVKEERDMGKDKGRSSVDLELKGDTLSMVIRSEDIVGLRAAVNTWLRLFKIAGEMRELCHP